jgi:hypothetical protein
MALPGMNPRMRAFARVAIVLLYPGLIIGALIDLLVHGVALVVLWPAKWSRRRTELPPKPRRRVP